MRKIFHNLTVRLVQAIFHIVFSLIDGAIQLWAFLHLFTHGVSWRGIKETLSECKAINQERLFGPFDEMIQDHLM